jgi:hypothetical protein
MVVAIIALCVAGTGAAVAAIPGSDGTISACYKPANGNLRVIDAGERCKHQERLLTWRDGVNGKVANADLLDGIDSTGFLTADGKAVDSDKLDGRDSTDFLSATGTAVNADKLDGIDSSSLVLHCPTGYTRSRDVCFTPQKTGTFNAAWFDCLNSGGRLPNSTELANVFPALAVAGGVPEEVDWSSDFLGGGQALAVRVSGFIIGWEEHAFGDSLGYRCILSPTNDGTVSLAARSRAGSGDASEFHKAN